MDPFKEAQKNFLKKERHLSRYAAKSKNAIRLAEQNEDLRPAYFHDIDRIIHSLSYTRYLNKTQVYSNSNNDHISRRITHVQLVSKIARTIGRALNLNEDLIEAIALGHDIGHTPLGHNGERMIAKICKKELQQDFAHNIQGVRYYLEVANKGQGYNLTIQVLDGIMCHNGELLEPIYHPQQKTLTEFLEQYQIAYQDLALSKTFHPMTLEGCVVRISDIIGYIGRDIEDAIRLGVFCRKDLPKEITNVLGDNNRTIINTIILDIIKESLRKPYIKMSKKVFTALQQLKNFNYEHIYRYALSKEEYRYYEKGMEQLFKKYVKDIKNNQQESAIFQAFLLHQKEEYQTKTPPKRQVIDFLCGMTDDYFMKQLTLLEKHHFSKIIDKV